MNKRRIPMHHSATRINALPRLFRPLYLGVCLPRHRPGAGSTRVEKIPEKGVHGRLGAMCGQIALDVLVVFAGAGLQLGQDGKIAFEQVASVIQ
jgi:hypothetical protein